MWQSDWTSSDPSLQLGGFQNRASGHLLGLPDVYARPQHMLDFVLGFPIGGFSGRLRAQNILDLPIEAYVGDERQAARSGRTFSINIAYKNAADE